MYRRWATHVRSGCIPRFFVFLVLLRTCIITSYILPVDVSTSYSVHHSQLLSWPISSAPQEDTENRLHHCIKGHPARCKLDLLRCPGLTLIHPFHLDQGILWTIPRHASAIAAVCPSACPPFLPCHTNTVPCPGYPPTTTPPPPTHISSSPLTRPQSLPAVAPVPVPVPSHPPAHRSPNTNIELESAICTSFTRHIL